jgi:hypothetical protein
MHGRNDYANHTDRVKSINERSRNKRRTKPRTQRKQVLPGITRSGRLVARRKITALQVTALQGDSRWECLCDCGNTHTILAKSLLAGDIKSCGCLHRLRPYEHLYKRLLWRAKKFNLEVKMTYEEFLTFVQVQECHYCGDPIEWSMYKSTKHTTSAYNLDRLKGNEGYTLNNVVVCCRRCNLRRGQFTPDEWKVMISALKQYQNVKVVLC